MTYANKRSVYRAKNDPKKRRRAMKEARERGWLRLWRALALLSAAFALLLPFVGFVFAESSGLIAGILVSLVIALAMHLLDGAYTKKHR